MRVPDALEPEALAATMYLMHRFRRKLCHSMAVLLSSMSLLCTVPGFPRPVLSFKVLFLRVEDLVLGNSVFNNLRTRKLLTVKMRP
jgi:hypothetical protein